MNTMLDGETAMAGGDFNELGNKDKGSVGAGRVRVGKSTMCKRAFPGLPIHARSPCFLLLFGKAAACFTPSLLVGLRTRRHWVIYLSPAPFYIPTHLSYPT
jgi:hypothetical protein